MQSTKRRLAIGACALVILGGVIAAADAVGKAVGTGADAPVVSVPLERDRFGVAILETERSDEARDAFLKRARLRADLAESIVVR